MTDPFLGVKKGLAALALSSFLKVHIKIWQGKRAKWCETSLNRKNFPSFVSLSVSSQNNNKISVCYFLTTWNSQGKLNKYCSIRAKEIASISDLFIDGILQLGLCQSRHFSFHSQFYCFNLLFFLFCWRAVLFLSFVVFGVFIFIFLVARIPIFCFWCL